MTHARGRRAIAALLVAAAWALASPAAAGSLASACQLDFQLFCPALDPESARAEVVACLEQNLAALTEECRVAVDPALAPAPRRAEDGLGAACRADFARLCPREPDRASFARCVHRHRRDLSAACRDALDAAAGAPVAPPGLP